MALDTHGLSLFQSEMAQVETWQGAIIKTFPDGVELNLSEGAPANFTISLRTNEGEVQIELSADDARDVIAMAEQLTAREDGRYWGAQYLIEARVAIAGN